MSENQATINDARPKTKRVPIQERSVLVENAVVINGHGVNRSLLRQRFSEGGYQAHETAHFLLFIREVLLLSMVDNSTGPFQTYFGPVDGHEAVLTDHVTLE